MRATSAQVGDVAEVGETLTLTAYLAVSQDPLTFTPYCKSISSTGVSSHDFTPSEIPALRIATSTLPKNLSMICRGNITVSQAICILQALSFPTYIKCPLHVTLIRYIPLDED